MFLVCLICIIYLMCPWAKVLRFFAIRNYVCVCVFARRLLFFPLWSCLSMSVPSFVVFFTFLFAYIFRNSRLPSASVLERCAIWRNEWNFLSLAREGTLLLWERGNFTLVSNVIHGQMRTCEWDEWDEFWSFSFHSPSKIQTRPSELVIVNTLGLYLNFFF